MAKKYLDYNGLQYFWQKIKSIIPNFTSDLTNDSGFVTTDDDIEWVDVDASNAKNTTLIENGTIVYPNTVKEAVYGLEEELNKKEVTIGSTPDEDAVLWIEPDGDVTTPIYAPNTAQVGQTIVVSAVDENGRPTVWEAVDMPQGSGGAMVVTVTHDDDYTVYTADKTYSEISSIFPNAVMIIDGYVYQPYCIDDDKISFRCVDCRAMGPDKTQIDWITSDVISILTDNTLVEVYTEQFIGELM